MGHDINKYFCTARLVQDCKVFGGGQGGMAVTKSRIVVNEARKKKDSNEWEDVPQFFNITIWGQRGEAFARFHKKGSRCALEGRLRRDEWTDKKTGEKRNDVYLSVDNWSFVLEHRTKDEKARGSGDGQPDADSGESGTVDWNEQDQDSPMAVDDTPF